MSLHVIEGTWEEIKRHEAELIGRYVRLTIKADKPSMRKPIAQAKAVKAQPRRVSAMGKYAGILSTEDFMREKLDEIDLEDRACL